MGLADCWVHPLARVPTLRTEPVTALVRANLTQTDVEATPHSYLRSRRSSAGRPTGTASGCGRRR